MTGGDASTYPCPVCGAPAAMDGGCQRCGRGPGPTAAEMMRLDQRLYELANREAQLRQDYAAVRAELAQVRARRDALATHLTTVVPPASAQAAAVAPPARPAPPHQPESSTRTVQTLLFVLGGLLVGTGAIVFTAVAWTRFGVGGRAAILAVVTALVLAAPMVARRRGLRGTAETFAALGLLLLLLDGYAVWSVDLLAAGSVPGATWAGLTCAVVAAIGVGYARGFRLTGPAFVAIVLAQPVLPLLAVEPRPDATGWAYVWAGVAAGDVALARLLRPAGGARQALTWVLTGVALTVTGLLGVTQLLLADSPGQAALAGGALLAAVVVLAGVAWVSRISGWMTTTVAVAVPATVLVAARVLVLGWPQVARLLTAIALAAVVAAAAGLGRLRPQWRRGVLIGGLVVTGCAGVVLAAETLSLAVGAVEQAWWRQGPLAAPAGWVAVTPGSADWQLLAALALVAAALVALTPRGWPEVTVALSGLVALAAPAALSLAWWAPVVAGTVVAAVLALAAARAATDRMAVLAGLVGALLAAHAVLVGAATTATLAGALGALVLIGAAAAAVAHRVPAGPGARIVVGRVALLVGLVAWPGAVAASAAATGLAGGWPARAALAACALLVGVVALVRRVAAEHLATAAAAVHVATPVAIIGGLAEGAAVVAAYGAGALLLLAATGWLRRPARPGWWLATRAPAALVVVVATATPVAVVLLGPYEWLTHVWRGAPSGTGVAVDVAGPHSPAAAAALLLLAAAAALSDRIVSDRAKVGWTVAAMLAPLALLVGLAQLGAPWPVIPTVSLVLGIAGLLVAGLRLTGGVAGVAGAYALLLAGAGLAGALAARWSTVAALAVAVVTAAMLAAAGRALTTRVAGCAAATGFGALLALAACRAAGLPLATSALVVLAVAAVALAASARWWPPPRRLTGHGRQPEGVALEAAAHAAALAALLLTLPRTGYAAVVVALWGVVLGLRALRPGEPARGRVARAGAAGGCELLAWWLLLASWQVGKVEAYTLPAAAVGVAVGALVLRARPEVGSPVALAPALAAGFLPSLYLSLADPAPLRRLLLGGAAVAVVLIGATQRWKAPVLFGGAVAAAVALRELALVWQLVDAWIPLTAAGLLLVALAATYERRRRDLARLRGTFSQMS